MLRLIQSKGPPLRRIFRQLAELGVPCSMTEALVGCTLDRWREATPTHEARLQALWALAEAYTDVANREPGAVEGLESVVIEAQQLGVWYEPPCCAAVVIDRRANKVRRFVEDIESPCRPGRSSSADRLWRGVLAALPVESKQTREQERIVELRLKALSSSEIADEVGLSEAHVRRLLRLPEVMQAIEMHRPLEQVEAEVTRRARQARSETMKGLIAQGKVKVPVYRGNPGRPRKGWDDAWILTQVEQGETVAALAKKLGTSRQALSWRIQQARRRTTPPPL